MKNKCLKRFISSVVCLSMVLCIVLPAAAASDGYYKLSQNGKSEIKLIDANRIGDIFSAGALTSDNTVGDDRYSIKWKNITSQKTLSFYRVPRDWSDINEIRFSVYTEKPTNVVLNLAIFTDYREGWGSLPYYHLANGFSMDHTGWKEVVLTKDDFTEYYATGWDKIRYIRFSVKSGTVDGDANFCISSVYGDTTEKEPTIKTEVTEKGRAAVLKALGTNTAMMNFSNNIIKNGKVYHVKVSDRITTDIDGATIAKFGLFTNSLGATVNDENGKVTISLDGKTADVTENIVTYDDGKYLKVNPTLSALGKTVKNYDMVTIIGDEEKTSKIFNDDALLEDLKFMLNERVLSTEDITQADWDFIKKKWTEYIIGPAEDIDTPEKQAKLKEIDDECMSAIRTINKNPNVWAFFGNRSLSSTSEVLSQFYKVKYLAKAYASYGSKFYKDPDVARLALNALDWLSENGYSFDELIGQGVHKSAYGDWSFLVGIPMELTEILLLLGDSVSMDLIEKYLYLHENSKYNSVFEEAGRIYASTLSAVLHQDYDELIKRNYDYVALMHPKQFGVDEVLRRKRAGEGVQEDYTYITHDVYIYNSAYGCTTLLDRLVTVEGILMGTNFEFVNPYKYDPIIWMKETFGPVAFNGALSSSVSGRFRGTDSYYETKYIQYVIASCLDLIGCFGKDDDKFLKQFIKRNVVPENRKDVEGFLNSYQIELLGKIISDESIVVEPYYNSKVYRAGDAVAHQRDDFGFALAMSSSRIGAWESIDGQNITGWYQGDGMLYTYIKDDVLQYNRDYWKYSNPYHLPGTTVDTQERIAASIGDSGKVLTGQHFVGGVQFDSDYSVAAMQLKSHSNDNPDAVIATTKSGPAPHHISSLMAKKAWFLFDDEAVALGADINANDGFEVQTVIENRKLNLIEKLVKEEKIDENVPKKFTEYKIVDVDDEGTSEEANPPENSFDDDMTTRLSAKGDVTITWKLEKAVPIGFIGIAQYGGTDGKQAIFELEISADGDKWTQVFAGKASGQTEDMEAYSIGGKQAKFIRYIGHGRTNSQWNSITEVKFFAPTPDGKLPDEALSKVPVVDTSDPNKGRLMGAEKIFVDGTLLEKVSNYTKEFKNPKWAHIENVGGYYFPLGGELKMDKVTNNNNFLEMWFSHGVSPDAGTYAYVVLPTKTVEETESYTKSPDIEILSNTKELQVVREKTLGMTGLVFWSAGKFENIEASVPMIMMTKDKAEDGTYRISLSDPTKLLKEGKVTLKGNYEPLEGDRRFTVTQKGAETVISIDFGGAEGRTLPITLLAK